LGCPLAIHSTVGRSMTLPLKSTPGTGKSYKACRDWIESLQIQRITIPQTLAAIYIHKRSTSPLNSCHTPMTFVVRPLVLPPTATGRRPLPHRCIHLSLRHLLDALQHKATTLLQPHSVNKPCNTFPGVAAPPHPVTTQVLRPSMVVRLHPPFILIAEEGSHEHAEGSQQHPLSRLIPVRRHSNHRTSLPVVDRADVAP
jgi:hypothetical protein